MLTYPCRRALVTTLAAMAVAVALTGCETQDSKPERTVGPTATSSMSTGASTPGSSAPAPDARLVPGRGSGLTCLAGNKAEDVVGFLDPTARAQGDLQVSGVEVVGRGVELIGAQGSVASLPEAGEQSVSGVSVIDDAWPLERLPDGVDAGSVGDLVGFDVRDGQILLPLVGVRVSPEAHLEGLEVSYVWGGDPNNAATVVLAMDLDFPAGGCKL